VVGGGAVIETLLEALGAEQVVVSGEGVREGLARSLATDRLAPSPAVRRASLDALAGRFAGWSRERADRRERVAEALRGALLPAAGELAETLALAARVLDIGRTVDFFDRHEHVADLLLATDLGGFSHRQVALLAALVRRAGDEDARERSLAPLVTREDRRPLERVAALLALADEVTERCPPGSTAAVAVRLRREEAVVGVPALGAWGPPAIDQRFRAAFSRRLRVVAGERRRR
jgi:exopolyphosphatase/guanosine-5'-triphosphate,3'-diphosphate pyrophosphatase